MTRLLLIEDEIDLASMLEDRLRAAGHEVHSVSDGGAALAAVAALDPDLIILDLMLPGTSGFDACRELRRRGCEAPVLMLTARGQTADKVLGLRMGADDYVTKPFDVLELLARIEALLRRRGRTTVSLPAFDDGPAQRHQFGAVEVDFRRAEVTVGGKEVALSSKELALLRLFVTRAGQALSRDEILDAVWGADATPGVRTVDVHVAALRRKLETNPHHPTHILTVHGLGYKFAG